MSPAHLTPNRSVSGLYPSGFTPPPVPTGYTLKVFEDFLGTTLAYTAGGGKNAEGALWLPSHVTVANSVASINAYADPSIVGQFGVTSADLAANNNWVAGQFGINPTPSIGSNAKTRILVAVRADSRAGLSALCLCTGLSQWPPEIDFLEMNAPNTSQTATLHYGSGNTQQQFPTSGFDNTNWMVWGAQWDTSTFEFLVQTTPSSALTVWKTLTNPAPSGANSFAQNMYLAFQYQTFDNWNGSPASPQVPPADPTITAANPLRQQMDWAQICVG